MSFPFNGDLLANVAKLKTARTGRVSSWDHSGLNEDAWVVQPGETAVLADLEGPGTITHMWFAQTCRRVVGPGLMPYSKLGVPLMEVNNGLGFSHEVSDPDYYRKVLIRMYWDDSETPNVLAPLGDFFCVGHSMAANFQSLPFTVSVKPSEEKKYGGSAALNCYLQFPFGSRARIEIENQGDQAYIQYFYIDYELFAEPLSSDTLYFHAHWRRENPTAGWAPAELQTNSLETQVANLDGQGNYVILETTGAGQYIGCNHSIVHAQGTWWGEGDDMIWIDDDTWPPSMHGTGGEDYFGQAWGMQRNAFPFCGSIVHEEDAPGRQVSYRWHLVDPVRFGRRIRVTMETGHANHLRDDWATTAYWYQTLPGPRLEMLPVERRIPSKPEFPGAAAGQGGVGGEGPSAVKVPGDETRRAMVEQRRERMEAFVKDREAWLERRAQASRERARKNTEDARDLRRRFLEGLRRDREAAGVKSSGGSG